MARKNEITNIERHGYNLRDDRDSLTTTEGDKNYTPEWYSMVTDLPGDMTRFAAKLIELKKIPLYFGIAGITAGLMTVDNRVWLKERMWYDRSPGFRTFTDDMVWMGDGRFQFGVAGVFAAYGIAFNNSRAMRTGSEIAEAILASGAIDQLIKHISGRQRPADATQPGGDWTFVPNPISYQKHVPQYDAFPSGHITSATAMLVVIAGNYPELNWFRPASYVMMGAIAMSLDAYGYHWWSDIPLGVFLGYTFGEIVSHPLALKLSSSSSGRSTLLVLRPVMVPDGVGVGLNMSF
ncbi:MAG TPA: phosphatase PAP2 family protein [Candidatus Kryptobacter bacterium]|nr:phosphatase PAP2 family protein [Candidatus Kryptobacter bacterium]